MCHYAGPHRMSKNHSQGIQQHLRQLEAQIGQLSQFTTDSQRFRPTETVPLLQVQSTGDFLSQPEVESTLPGTMQVNQDGQYGTRYVDSTHWQAVLHQVGPYVVESHIISVLAQ